MQKYELLYIVASNLNEEQIDEVNKKVEAIIVKNAGVIDSVENSGLKKLAYPINDRTDGYYVLVNYQAQDKAPNAIDAALNIVDGIVRHMTIAK